MSDLRTMRAVGTGLLASLVVLVLSQGVEWFINRVLRPDAAEWTWISEAIVSAGLIVVMLLWIQLREARQALTTLERQQVVLDTQLSIAAEVQRALLPATPAPIGGIEWCAETAPAGKVGGDFFDFLPLPGGRMGVVLADVSGKGIPAAIFLSNVRAVVRALVRETEEPKELARRLSEAVSQDAPEGTYVSAILAVVDPGARRLTYTNAGHPAGMILRHNRPAYAMQVGGPPAGLLPNLIYDQETVAFGPEDLVVLATDGVTESLNTSSDGLLAAVPRVFDGLRLVDPSVACQRLLDAAERGSGPTGVDDWTDDKTVVSFGGQVAMGAAA